jgi:hypothetical protein
MRRFALLFVLAPSAWAAPVQWLQTDGGNDHYYEYVTTRVNWDEARASALNLGGYLATVTSPSEQAFLYSMFPEMSWIGGSDRDEEGVWRWMDGPEAGLIFWNHGPTDAFSFWHAATDEPNNEAGGENYLQFAFAQEPWDPIGAWNDDGGPGHSLLTMGYIVEYGGSSVVPIPSAAWLLGGALGLLQMVRRRQMSGTVN